MRSTLLVAAAIALISGCGRRPDATSNSSADASVAPATPAPTARTTRADVAPLDVVRTVRRFDALAARVTTGLRVVDDGRGFVVAGRAAAGFERVAQRVVARAPHASGEPLRVGLEARPDFFVDVRALGVANVAGAVADGAVVYPSVAADLDLLHVAARDQHEEIRLLRSAAAPSVARYSLELGPGVANVRLEGRTLHVLDAAGVSRLVVDPPFAVDASGLRRELDVALEVEGKHPVLTTHLDVAGLRYPVAIDPTFRATPPVGFVGLSTHVQAFSFGGNAYEISGDTVVRRFDPPTYTWVGATAMQGGHDGGAISLLNSGQLAFLMGGTDVTQPIELWNDGALNTVYKGTTTQQRQQFGWVHTGSGTNEVVWFFGGEPGVGSGTYYNDVTRLSVAGAARSAGNLMLTGRARFDAIPIDATHVLLAGGFSTSNVTNAAELYDISTSLGSSVATATPMTSPRSNYKAVALPSGKFIIIGGDIGAYSTTNTTDIYDPATNSFSAGPLMRSYRYDYAMAQLADGRYLIAGGYGHVGTASDADLSTTEIFDPVAMTFTDGPTMRSQRDGAGAVAISGGRVIIVGGIGTSYDYDAEVFTPDPVTCTGPSAGCANCVDGYCCDTSCTGQCQACDVSGAEGVCTYVVGSPPHGSRTACSPFLVCGAGGVCTTTCASDAACATTAYCDSGAASPTCVARKSNGAACAGSNQCTSGNCVDGVCCDLACAGQCVACDVAGSVGTCSPVTGVPHGARGACPAFGYACAGGSCATTCTADNQCDGTHYCAGGGPSCVAKVGLGTACTSASQCASGFCVDGYCCNSACTSNSCAACDVASSLGTCTTIPNGKPHGSRTCTPANLCAAGACSGTCVVDGDCPTGDYCKAGVCTAKKAPGSGCGNATECASGFCSGDGYCCNAACNGECQTCGTGTCSPKSAAFSCGIAGCVGNALIATGHCSGTDFNCVPGATTPCASGLECADFKSCLTTCTKGTDCVSGACDAASGTCITGFEVGVDAGPDVADVADTAAPDTSAPDTSTPDTTTPDTAVADTSATEAAPMEAGEDVADVPSPPVSNNPQLSPTVPFVRCNKNSDCMGGMFCVDGVCCDSLCDQPCHSCALLANPGHCTLEPAGVDLRNECGPAHACIGTCGGAGNCIGAGKNSMCARNICTGQTTGEGPAFCDGPGEPCPSTGVPFDCSPYVCEPAFGACRADCATSADCANGFTCATDTRTCVADAPNAGKGGCSFGGGAQSERRGLAGLALLGALVMRRRRTRR
jgi:hypothetical protein